MDNGTDGVELSTGRSFLPILHPNKITTLSVDRRQASSENGSQNTEATDELFTVVKRNRFRDKKQTRQTCSTTAAPSISSRISDWNEDMGWNTAYYRRNQAMGSWSNYLGSFAEQLAALCNVFRYPSYPKL
ncbi:unnamed protein product [Peronospora belbahrii]|uniref:Uncharacterized protein n=1 Tax=Peronospora belbahrii TaxID=622444 RepID=A0ABN8CLQ0_9STRA|nr:unnamed protein product [Peronospora belbahrii]